MIAGVILIILAVAEVWWYFVEPSIEAREDSINSRREKRIEEKRLDLEILKEKNKLKEEEAE